MLEREEPNLATIAPRWTDKHHAMAVTALQVSTHVYLEKPITQNDCSHSGWNVRAAVCHLVSRLKRYFA